MAKHTRNTSEEQAAALAENPAFQDDLARALESIVPQGYTEQQISFPPYWKPGALMGWRGTILRLDNRDESFPRYVIESAMNLECRRGPTNDGEIIDIEPGMEFTMGVYAALPLHDYFDLEVAVVATHKTRLPPSEDSDGRPRDLWNFRLFTSDDVTNILKKRKAAERAHLRELHDVERKKRLIAG